jgi:hypothetical protein
MLPKPAEHWLLLGDIRRISRELAAEDLLVCVAIARFAEIHFIRVAILSHKERSHRT